MGLFEATTIVCVRKDGKCALGWRWPGDDGRTYSDEASCKKGGGACMMEK